MCTQRSILKHNLKVGLVIRCATNPTFSFCFHILLCVHISNGSFYQALLHIHCKQLGSQLAFYELIYVRPVFLN